MVLQSVVRGVIQGDRKAKRQLLEGGNWRDAIGQIAAPSVREGARAGVADRRETRRAATHFRLQPPVFQMLVFSFFRRQGPWPT